MKVKKAIVLAAGLGMRLRPFTCVTPKPLMPIWGESMLSRMVQTLRSLGVTEIAVNCHYLHEQIERWCTENGCTVSYEPEILGTGGLLNPLRDWIGSDDFYLVNGDIVIEGFRGFRGFKGFDSSTLGICLTTQVGPRTIEVEPETGYVTNWRSDDAGYPGTFTYCGFALLSNRILDYVETDGYSSLVSAYERAMMDGLFMKAVSPQGLLWEDCGSIKSLIAINSDGEDNAFADFPQLRATGAKDFKFLAARGSNRVFFACDKGIAVLYDDSDRRENGLYATHAEWLRGKGIPVPSVVFNDPSLKTIVFEYVGEERKMSLDEYAHVIEALVKFNSLGSAPDLPELMPAFDRSLWQWERELFVEYCLKSRFGLDLPNDVEAELCDVAERLEQEPKALVHRDFQSTNILWMNSSPAFIDFQGMRLGPAVYDLASIVYDPYVVMQEKHREALVKLYAQRSRRPEVERVLPFAAVQRLIQCLGAYGRLASVGQTQFSKYVLPALVNLLDAADAAGLNSLGALAEDLIAREKHSFESQGHCNCQH